MALHRHLVRHFNGTRSYRNEDERPKEQTDKTASGNASLDRNIPVMRMEEKGQSTGTISVVHASWAAGDGTCMFPRNSDRFLTVKSRSTEFSWLFQASKLVTSAHRFSRPT